MGPSTMRELRGPFPFRGFYRKAPAMIFALAVVFGLGVAALLVGMYDHYGDNDPAIF